MDINEVQAVVYSKKVCFIKELVRGRKLIWKVFQHRTFALLLVHIRMYVNASAHLSCLD